MEFIALSILSSTMLLILFRFFPSFGVNAAVAITCNYLVAGFISSFQIPTGASMEFQWWMPVAACMGVLFMLVFVLMAKTTEVTGVAMASLAAKLSMVIPIAFGLIFLHESLPIWGWLGIVAGFLSIVLVAGPVKGGKFTWHIPVLFLGAGAVDLFVNMFSNWVDVESQPLLRTCIFASSFLTGLILNRKDKFTTKNVLGGIILGTVNFGSLYFLMRSLESGPLPSATLFPVNNLGIIGLSSVLAFVIFREKLSPRTWAGLLVGALALVLLMLPG